MGRLIDSNANAGGKRMSNHRGFTVTVIENEKIRSAVLTESGSWIRWPTCRGLLALRGDGPSLVTVEMTTPGRSTL